jgi:hypothetical protein
MKREIKIAFALSSLVVLFGISEVQAVDVYFYSDAVIKDGDVYTNVFIYDTPPDRTIIDMFGGSVYRFRTYDSTIINIYGGELEKRIDMWHSSTLNIYSGTVFLDNPGISGASTLNIYGGDIFMGAPKAGGSSTINVYGYDFSEFPAFSLTGFLADGSPFEFVELTYAQSHMNLILVSEPLVAKIDIHPDTLNLASKGSWINCRISLPVDCNATGINPDSVLLEGRVKADSILFNEQQQTAIAKFNRSDAQEILDIGEIELTVTGHLVDGTYFAGIDTIKVINKIHE